MGEKIVGIKWLIVIGLIVLWIPIYFLIRYINRKYVFNKPKEEIKEQIEEENTEPKIEVPERCSPCFYCGTAIYPHEKRKAFNGKKFHVKCFRKLKSGKI